MNLDYDLGEMKSENGAALRYEVEELAASTAREITQKLEERSAFKQLERKINNKNLKLYFHVLIKKEVYSSIVQLCVLRWYKRNDQIVDNSNKVICVPNIRIFPLLKEVWPDSEFPIELKKGITVEMKRCLPVVIKVSKKLLKSLLLWFDVIYNRILFKNYFALKIFATLNLKKS